MGHVTLVAIAETKFLISFLQVKSLQIMWRSGTQILTEIPPV